jgi:tetratricopeptide (TPR) repeat protein
MKKISQYMLLLLCINCVPSYVEHIVTPQGGVLKIGNATFEIPKNSIAETTLIRIERKIVTRRTYSQGFFLTGEKFIITPESLMFDKPVVFSYPGQAESTTLGAHIGNGFVPLAGTKVKGDTLRANIWHGGRYYVISKPDTYGIIYHSDSKEALLIVCDIYVSDYVKEFSRALRWGGYRLPIWEFIYPTENTIEDNALLLAEELKNLHNQYGEFTLDVVSFGIGGLITHRYVADTGLYQRDLSPAIITIGTPFYGSNFAHLDSVKKGKSPYRFFFIDALGEHAQALAPESELIDWIKTHKNLRGGWLKDPKEDKNPASLSGKVEFPGVLPEEQSGDGLVSLSSTMLTAIEPEPFNLSHFDLYEDNDVLKIVTEFVKLYRSFAWMDLFLNVWADDQPFKKISDIWAQEAKLNFRNEINFEVLLEFNKNMLTSTPQNGILITNGDNDTYPAWYLQERGVRTDVLIVNRNLFNLKEYVRFLQRQGLPLKISEEELDKIQHYKDDTGEFFTISDQLIKMLLRQNERPVVFATTVYEPQRYGVPLRLSGKVYEIGEESVNIERTKQLLYEEFTYDKIFSVSPEILDANIQNLAANYAASAWMLSTALKEQKEYTEALQAIRFARRFVSDRWEYMPYYNEASIYLAMGEYEVADSMYKMVLSMPSVSSDVKQDIALIYHHEYGQSDVAIKILAECLKDNPGDKQILELIEKFQEEL